MTKPIEPSPAAQLPDLTQLACLQTLDTAAEMFEASPRQSFTRAEVVRLLRLFKSELFDETVVIAYEIGLLDVDITSALSKPS